MTIAALFRLSPERRKADRQRMMALARAEEALIAAHVDAIVQTVLSLMGDMPAEQAIAAYFRRLRPPEDHAETIRRRAYLRLYGPPAAPAPMSTLVLVMPGKETRC